MNTPIALFRLKQTQNRISLGSIVALLISALSLICSGRASGQTVSGREHFATADTSDMYRYYSNAEAASLGYGINAGSDGYIIACVSASFANRDYWFPEEEGGLGAFLIFSDLVVGQQYQVSIAVGNHNADLASFCGILFDDFSGMTDWSNQGAQMTGPPLDPSIVGWADGVGRPITWNNYLFTFTATDTTANISNLWDSRDYNITEYALAGAGYPDTGFSEYAIGNIEITLVPEPSSIFLLGAASVCFIFRRKLSQKTNA